MADPGEATPSDSGTAAAGSAEGRTVGRYKIVSQIGRGGMAVVYLARQRDLDRLVALKELSAFHAGSKEFSERFLRESRLAGSLTHPNIVTVHEYFEESGIPYIAMEYVPRGSLRPWVGKLTLPQLVGVLEGILAGLAHAEPTGIVHRDMKPENIMIDADGRVKIADFGIAKATQGAGTAGFMTATGMTVGTPTYMAPEQAMAQQIGPWTDLYSVGVMAHEQIVGRAPFQETEAPMVILMRHVNERIPSVSELKPRVDPALSDWVDRLLVKDPADRTSHAAQAWDELEEIVINIVGPRWRREARLADQGPLADTPAPLTPAPFESQQVKTPEGTRAPSSSGFVTYDPGAPVRVPPPDAGIDKPATPAESPAPSSTPAPQAESPAAAGAASSASAAAAASVAAGPEAPAQPRAPVDPQTPVEAQTLAEPQTPAEPKTSAETKTSAEPETPVEQDAGATPAPPSETPATAESRFITFGADSGPAAPEAQEVTAEPQASGAASAESPAVEASKQGEAGDSGTPPAGAPTDEPQRGSQLLTLAPSGRASAPPREALPPSEPQAASGPAAEEAGAPAVADATAPAAGETSAAPATAEPTAAPSAEERTAGPGGVKAAAAIPVREGAAPPTAHGERRVQPRLLALAGVAALLAALVGFFASSSGSSKKAASSPTQLTGSAANSSLGVALPTGWAQQTSVPTIPGLQLSNALAVAEPSAGGELVVGNSSSSGPTLLPASLLTALGSTPHGEPVRLGELELYRYKNLMPNGAAAPETVYALSTTNGTVVAACVLPSHAAATVNADCERILGSLRLGSAKALALGPSSTYAAAIAAAIGRLNPAAAGGSARLQRAGTPSAQAAAASGLGAAYERAATSVSGAKPAAAEQPTNRGFAAALRQVGSGYKAMARAARSGNRGSYDAAQSSVRSGLASILAAYRELQTLGYKTTG
jgi:serine/threonine protein kinase